MINAQESWQERARRIAHGIRKRTLELTIANDGCYLSQALSSAEIFATLYSKILNLGPSQGEPIPPRLPESSDVKVFDIWGGRYHGEKAADKDRLLVSAAHYAVAVYAALVEMGRLDPEGLKQFNTDGSTVEMIGAEHSPGFELTTGSFGQCVSQAGGIAIARKRWGETGRVFAFLGDGELQEGQTWEGLQAVSFYGVDNLVIYIDVNGQQYDGWTKDVMNIEPLTDRLESFGVKAVSVDGHDVDALYEASNQLEPGRPLAVLCYTDSSRGLPFLEKRKPKLHYVRFTQEEKQEFVDFYKTM